MTISSPVGGVSNFFNVTLLGSRATVHGSLVVGVS